MFLNLLLNARDAMPSGGWLTLATRVERGEAVAEVSDTGNGIPAEHLARIYDPFFTTKATGQGTGLGLSITYGIVREHDGSIHCDSAPGQGTRFTLRLHRHRAAVTSDARSSADSVPRSETLMRRNASILVIDDEEIMREILETLLVREGYTVRLASNGAEGLDLAQSLPFDAVIVDVMMPGIDGLQVLDELRKHDEELPVDHDHGLRLDGERHLRDEEGRVRLHHQAVQERRSAGRAAQRRSNAAVWSPRTSRSSRTCRRAITASPASSARARG